MFPTGVGMNRRRLESCTPQFRVPHGRGDEPDTNLATRGFRQVFPTGVGMNRAHLLREAVAIRVPHGRGDEPSIT